MTNPKPVATLEAVEDALEEWAVYVYTHIRHFVLAGGKRPDCASRRTSLIHMLPPDISAHVTMQLDQHATYEALKRYVLKYIKVMTNLKGRRRPAHLIDIDGSHEPSEMSGQDEETDEEQIELMDRLLTTDDVDEKLEILAFMKTRGFRPPTRGQGGAKPPPRFGAAAARQPARFGAAPPLFCHLDKVRRRGRGLVAELEPQHPA